MGKGPGSSSGDRAFGALREQGDRNTVENRIDKTIIIMAKDKLKHNLSYEVRLQVLFEVKKIFDEEKKKAQGPVDEDELIRKSVEQVLNPTLVNKAVVIFDNLAKGKMPTPEEAAEILAGLKNAPEATRMVFEEVIDAKVPRRMDLLRDMCDAIVRASLVRAAGEAATAGEEGGC